MNPFCAKNLKTAYNVTPYGDHGTERVNDVKRKSLEHVAALPNTESPLYTYPTPILHRVTSNTHTAIGNIT